MHQIELRGGGLTNFTCRSDGQKRRTGNFDVHNLSGKRSLKISRLKEFQMGKVSIKTFTPVSTYNQCYVETFGFTKFMLQRIVKYPKRKLYQPPTHVNVIFRFHVTETMR
jgi:hypothetical protein